MEQNSSRNGLSRWQRLGAVAGGATALILGVSYTLFGAYTAGNAIGTVTILIFAVVPSAVISSVVGTLGGWSVATIAWVCYRIFRRDFSNQERLEFKWLQVAVAIVIAVVLVLGAMRVQDDLRWQRIAASKTSTERELRDSYQRALSGTSLEDQIFITVFSVLFPGSMSHQEPYQDRGIMFNLADNPNCPKDVLLEMTRSNDPRIRSRAEAKAGTTSK
ncbi:MAG: hypothetical protein V1495_00835 [Pseudomonadota bacterium]